MNDYSVSPWTWRDRLRFRLMPSAPCSLPNVPCPPFGLGDVLHVDTIVGLSFVDRLRVLLTGHLKVQTRTVTERKFGQHATTSVAYPCFKPEFKHAES